jgi:hypothetical protein
VTCVATNIDQRERLGGSPELFHLGGRDPERSGELLMPCAARMHAAEESQARIGAGCLGLSAVHLLTGASSSVSVSNGAGWSSGCIRPGVGAAAMYRLEVGLLV